MGGSIEGVALIETQSKMAPPSGAVKRAKAAAAKSEAADEPELSAKEVKARLRAARKNSLFAFYWALPKNVRTGVTFVVALTALMGLAYYLWPSSTSLSILSRAFTDNKNKIPSYMETLRAEVVLPAGVPAAQVFDYVRKPQTWVYWRSALRVHGAIDQAVKPGMMFTERALVEGVERDVAWMTTYTGSDGPTRTRVSLTGSITGLKCDLRTSFVISYAAATTSKEVSVKQTLSFGAKGMTAEKKAVLGKEYKEQMTLSLKRLRQRLSK